MRLDAKLGSDREVASLMRGRPASEGGSDPALINPDEMTHLFGQHKFEAIRHEVVPFELMAEERKLMWLCPGVLDSVVDILKLGIPRGKTLVEEAFADVGEEGSLPMSVAYWVFRRAQWQST
jgi:hypothetical protein